MMEAEAVNRRGYYVIGSSKSFADQESAVTLENSLHLYVPEKKNGVNSNKEDSTFSQENVKLYKLNDIGDLQSKLMLIGGQQGKEREMGQIEKDCFLQVSFLELQFKLRLSPLSNKIVLLCTFEMVFVHTLQSALR